MIRPSGGSSKKPDEGVQIPNPMKSGVIVFPGKDVEVPELKKTRKFKEALEILDLKEKLIYEDSSGIHQTITIEIKEVSDMIEKGIVEQVPDLNTQKKQTEILHKLHNNLDKSDRLKSFFDLLFSNEDWKNKLVSKLEEASISLLEFSNKNHK